MVYGKERIFFTGDVLFADQLTLTGARFPEEEFDTVVTETTRGARGAGAGHDAGLRGGAVHRSDRR